MTRSEQDILDEIQRSVDAGYPVVMATTFGTESSKMLRMVFSGGTQVTRSWPNQFGESCPAEVMEEVDWIQDESEKVNGQMSEQKQDTICTIVENEIGALEKVMRANEGMVAAERLAAVGDRRAVLELVSANRIMRSALTDIVSERLVSPAMRAEQAYRELSDIFVESDEQ